MGRKSPKKCLGKLERLAELCLCPNYHYNQKAEVVAEWKVTMSKVVTASERESKLRKARKKLKVDIEDSEDEDSEDQGSTEEVQERTRKRTQKRESSEEEDSKRYPNNANFLSLKSIRLEKRHKEELSSLHTKLRSEQALLCNKDSQCQRAEKALKACEKDKKAVKLGRAKHRKLAEGQKIQLEELSCKSGKLESELAKTRTRLVEWMSEQAETEQSLQQVKFERGRLQEEKQVQAETHITKIYKLNSKLEVTQASLEQVKFQRDQLQTDRDMQAQKNVTKMKLLESELADAQELLDQKEVEYDEVIIQNKSQAEEHYNEIETFKCKLEYVQESLQKVELDLSTSHGDNEELQSALSLQEVENAQLRKLIVLLGMELAMPLIALIWKRMKMTLRGMILSGRGSRGNEDGHISMSPIVSCGAGDDDEID